MTNASDRTTIVRKPVSEPELAFSSAARGTLGERISEAG
jgi:hypothetical protein